MKKLLLTWFLYQFLKIVNINEEICPIDYNTDNSAWMERMTIFLNLK